MKEDKRELYNRLLEDYTLDKADAIAFINYRIGVAVDKPKMLERISSNIDKLTILCGDLKLELRLHEMNPLFVTNNKQFYTTVEASEVLNVSTAKIRQLIDSGKLDCKKINQRNWQIPNWSLEAYKNDLCNFLFSNEKLFSDFSVVDVLDNENQLLVSLISKEGIHIVYEHETRLKRTITGIRSEL